MSKDTYGPYSTSLCPSQSLGDPPKTPNREKKEKRRKQIHIKHTTETRGVMAPQTFRERRRHANRPRSPADWHSRELLLAGDRAEAAHIWMQSPQPVRAAPGNKNQLSGLLSITSMSPSQLIHSSSISSPLLSYLCRPTRVRQTRTETTGNTVQLSAGWIRTGATSQMHKQEEARDSRAQYFYWGCGSKALAMWQRFHSINTGWKTCFWVLQDVWVFLFYNLCLFFFYICVTLWVILGCNWDLFEGDR